MVKRHSRLRWLAGGVIVLVAVYVGGGTIAAHRLIEGLLEVPSVEAVAAEEPLKVTDPMVLGYRGDPMEAFGLTFDALEMKGPWGLTPVWLIPVEGKKKGVTWAIYVHGISGRRENGYRYVPALHEASFPILLLSYLNDEGAPRSADGMYSYGTNEWNDLYAAVDYARMQGASDVLLVGDSMGGAIIGQFFRRSDYGWSISGVILDSPALDFSERMNNSLAPLHLPLTPLLVELAERTVRLQHSVPIDEANSVDALAAFPRQMLVIHGTGDRVIPVSTSDQLVGRRQGPTTVLRTGADHLETRKDHPEQFDATLRTFLASLKTEAPR